MRAFMGFSVIILFTCLFLFIFNQFSEELYSAQTIHEVLEERIEFDNVLIAANSEIRDRNGKVISDIYSGENRVFLDFHRIPQHVINMFLAVEDRKFYKHEGFDANGIARALLTNLQAQSIDQGGSTITQQVARNLYLSHEQTYERKISELLHAYQLEREMSKEEILELYVNSIYFANGVYGFDSASNFYFSKPAEDLSLGEIAYIGAIPNSPSRFDPLQHPEETSERQEYMLRRMMENEYISEDEYEEALEKKIELNLSSRIDEYPDYVTYVYAELEQLIASTEGFDSRLSSASEEEQAVINEELDKRVDKVLAKGIVIETALNPSIQEKVTSVIDSRLSDTSIQAAASVIDHHTAEITAITGGTNYNKFDFHRGYQSFRQPGSAIKPLLSFAPFLEEHTEKTPATIIDAGPFEADGYSPRNYGGAVYGLVTVEEALKHSYNTAAVRLLHKISIETGFSYLNKFDFVRILPEDYRLPSALGGFSQGTSVNELTQAYTVFSTEGKYLSPRAIRSVSDSDGEVLYEWDSSPKKVFNEETASELKGMLRQVITTGTGTEAFYSTSGYLGGKTGTSNDFNDLWFIGANSRYTAGVWIGKDQPESLEQESQGHLHTKMWRDIMISLD